MTVVVNNSNSSVVVNASSNSISFEIGTFQPATALEEVRHFTIDSSQDIQEEGYYIVYRSPTLTIPAAEDFMGKRFDIKNAGRGVVVVQSSSVIENSNVINVYPGDSISVFSNGEGWFLV